MEEKTKGKRICIVRNAESKTNASMIRVLDALLDSGHTCLLLTRSRINEQGGVTKKSYTHKGIRVDEYEIAIKAKMGRGLANLLQLFRYQMAVFFWLLRHRNAYDLLHVFDLDAALPARMARVFTGKKYVYHIADFYVDSRGGIPSFMRNMVKKLEFHVINRAEAAIVCTEQRKEQIAGSKPKRLAVIHNTPSITLPKEGEGLVREDNPPALTCAYVGVLSRRRFGAQVLAAFENRPQYRLLLAGLGPLAEEAEKTARSRDNIRYYGTIDYGEAISLLRRCDIMYAIYDPAVTNHTYSAPNKVYEAMLLGKPIIVAKGTGVDALVDKEKIGLSIPYEQIAFEQALDYLHDHPEERRAMARRAKEAFASYSWEEMKSRLIGLYEDIER